MVAWARRVFSDSEWNRDAAWHLGLAAVQLLVVIGLAVGSGTFEMDMTARQFPGHLGPSGFIMVFGVSALCYDRWSLEARARFEGRAALGAAVTYIVGDAMMATGRTFTFYMQVQTLEGGRRNKKQCRGRAWRPSVACARARFTFRVWVRRESVGSGRERRVAWRGPQ